LKLSALVLAAGASRRLGRPKQLLKLNGESLVHRAASLALGAGFSPVRVVLGAVDAELREALKDLPVRLLDNPDWTEGLASSLRQGVADWGVEEAGLLVLACDQPALDHEVLMALAEAFKADPVRPVACAYGGGIGLPALLPRRLGPELLQLRGDRGAKPILMREQANLVDFPGGLLDLDTPEDLQRWGLE